MTAEYVANFLCFRCEYDEVIIACRNRALCKIVFTDFEIQLLDNLLELFGRWFALVNLKYVGSVGAISKCWIRDWGKSSYH